MFLKELLKQETLLIFTETIIETFDELIIESGDANFREEGVIMKKRKYICIACGNEFTQWCSLIRHEKYNCTGLETGKKRKMPRMR